MGLFRNIFGSKENGEKKSPQQPPSLDPNAAKPNAVDVEPVSEADSKPQGSLRDALDSQSNETKAFNKLNVGYEHFKDHPYQPLKGEKNRTNTDLFSEEVTAFLDDKSLDDDIILHEDELKEPLKGFLGIHGSVSLADVRQAIREKLLPEIKKAKEAQEKQQSAAGNNSNQGGQKEASTPEERAQQKPGPIAFNKLNEAYKVYLNDADLIKLEEAAGEFRKSMGYIGGWAGGAVELSLNKLDEPLKSFLKIANDTTMGPVALAIEKFVRDKKEERKFGNQPQPAAGGNPNQQQNQKGNPVNQNSVTKQMINDILDDHADYKVALKYQPTERGSNSSFEQYLRVTHKGKPVFPDQIYARAEEMGVANKFDLGVLSNVENDLKSTDRRISVNVALGTIKDPTVYLQAVKSLPEEHRKRLTFEITEGAFVGASQNELIKFAEELTQARAKVVLDDIGNGYPNGTIDFIDFEAKVNALTSYISGIKVCLAPDRNRTPLLTGPAIKRLVEGKSTSDDEKLMNILVKIGKPVTLEKDNGVDPEKARTFFASRGLTAIERQDWRVTPQQDLTMADWDKHQQALDFMAKPETHHLGRAQLIEAHLQDKAPQLAKRLAEEETQLAAAEAELTMSRKAIVEFTKTLTVDEKSTKTPLSDDKKTKLDELKAGHKKAVDTIAECAKRIGFLKKDMAALEGHGKDMFGHFTEQAKLTVRDEDKNKIEAPVDGLKVAAATFTSFADGLRGAVKPPAATPDDEKGPDEEKDDDKDKKEAEIEACDLLNDIREMDVKCQASLTSIKTDLGEMKKSIGAMQQTLGETNKLLKDLVDAVKEKEQEAGRGAT